MTAKKTKRASKKRDWAAWAKTPPQRNCAVCKAEDGEVALDIRDALNAIVRHGARPRFGLLVEAIREDHPRFSLSDETVRKHIRLCIPDLYEKTYGQAKR